MADKNHKCSFCKREENHKDTEVMMISEDLKYFICDRCIGVCKKIIAEEEVKNKIINFPTD